MSSAGSSNNPLPDDYTPSSPLPTYGSKQTAVYANLISLILHLGFLLILAALVLPGSPIGSSSLSLTATVNSDSMKLDDQPFELAAASIDMERFEEQLASAELPSEEMELLEPTLDMSTPELTLEPMVDSEAVEPTDVEKLENVSLASSSKSARASSLKKLLATASRSGKNVAEPLMTAPAEGVLHANTVESATADLLGGLKQGIANDGFTKIIWLMDASLSLKEERGLLAPQVEEFYGQLLQEQQGLMEQDISMRVNSIVFAFGATLQPVRMDRGAVTPEAMSRAIEYLPIDESGVENVMTSLITAVSNVASGKKDERIEVVIWTDESGDDLHRLEDAIAICRTLKARVHVVGPLSVLGMRDGTQQFTLPKPWEYRVELPVMRGPDSAFPERAQLPMWFDSNADRWSDGPVVLAAESGNLGGPHRRKLLAPTGPYALTRLALATGGKFIALQREGDRASMQGDNYKDYLPDYGSGLEIMADIENKPLRRAIVEAAAITDAKIYSPPGFFFPTIVMDSYPYTRGILYVEPENFPGVLSQQISVHTRKLRGARQTVQQAIEVMLFRPGQLAASGTGYDSAKKKPSMILSKASIPVEYEYEKSPRWRAWYDLNLGRLLYQSVRMDSYVAVAEELTAKEAAEQIREQKFNSVTLRPSDNYPSSSEVSSRASLGRFLLERVVEEHPNTPWSQLAKWELEHSPGFAYDFGTVVKLPAGPMRPGPVTPAPRIPRL